jgi:sirohydrochlorin ferrochelatase
MRGYAVISTYTSGRGVTLPHSSHRIMFTREAAEQALTYYGERAEIVTFEVSALDMLDALRAEAEAGRRAADMADILAGAL